jgi:hypothetical protein
VAFVLLFAVLSYGADTRLDRAYANMYNLQFDQAHRILEEYEAQQPEDPMGPVSDAAACLFSEFDRLHILQSEFLTDDSRLLNSKAKPDPVIKARFDADLARTQQLAAAQMSNPATRANAMLSDTLRLGLSGDYLALIEGRDLAGLSQLKKARALAEQLLALYPSYYDAYLAVGAENYILSQKSAPVRWMLRMTGSETDKTDGLKKLRLAADHGHFLLPYARLLLAVAALRDGDRQTARQLLEWLAAQYPQNGLYRDELAKLGR